MKTRTVASRVPKPRSQRRFAPDAAASPAPRRAQIQLILVPIDFLDPSKAALQYAILLAEQFRAKLILLHVVEPVAAPDFAYYPLMMESRKVLVRNGTAFHEITEAAKCLKVDLLVIATHGYKGLKHLLLGSTTERVVRHATCPVLVVRHGSVTS